MQVKRVTAGRDEYVLEKLIVFFFVIIVPLHCIRISELDWI